MFFLVVVFGIFNGVVALPVILSVIGPAPYGGPIQSGDEVEVGNEMKSVEDPESSPKLSPGKK